MACAIVALVIAAVVAQNVRLRGPETVQEEMGSELWEGEITQRGWPWAYFERTESRPIASQYTLAGGPWHYEKISAPTASWRDVRTLAIAGDIVFGVLIVASTAFVAHFWYRSRKQKFQFRVRTLLIVTTAVAMALVLIESRTLSWGSLLYLPIAMGLVCIPATVGILLYHQLRWRSGIARRF